MFHKFIPLTAAATIVAGAAATVNSAPDRITPQILHAECTTKATGISGARHGCASQWQTVQAPKGHVFAKETLKVSMLSGGGSEKACNVAFDNNVAVIPGVLQPTTIKVQAKARSPRGYAAGRGWAKCRYEVNLVRFAE
jgi:hypothetical protein